MAWSTASPTDRFADPTESSNDRFSETTKRLAPGSIFDNRISPSSPAVGCRDARFLHTHNTRSPTMDKPEETTPVRRIKFLIHGPNVGGNGETLDEAKKNFREDGGSFSRQHIIWMWNGDDLPDKSYVD